MAFILGVAPLAASTGAGSGGQNAIGTGVVSGMVSATVLAIFLVPVFFVLVLRLFKVQRLNHIENANSEERESAIGT
jgi:multidrug efflux pump